ncbi:hypothetical protein VT06_16330 [Arsukibacterium sp. MJ3]|nr:hypothetical protein VT06_16330 [Arsukibacterium sp. MJ3]
MAGSFGIERECSAPGHAAELLAGGHAAGIQDATFATKQTVAFTFWPAKLPAKLTSCPTRHACRHSKYYFNSYFILKKT